MSVKTKAGDSATMPRGIPYIIANEAAERFSFYGMKAALVIFMTQYLHLMGSSITDSMSTAKANENAHWFVVAVYLLPYSEPSFRIDFGANTRQLSPSLSSIAWGMPHWR